MPDQILSGTRVLDLATGLAGSVAALLLAEAGADVLKIEGLRPPAAKPRHAGFSVWNRSKRRLRLGATQPDREKLQCLCAAADILIHDFTPTEAKAYDLDDGTLGRAFPHLIVASIGSFPAGHPEAERPVHDTLVLAASGIMDEQQGVKRAGPVFLRFPLGSWGAAYLAANGILARLIHRGEAPVGGPVRTSLFQGALVPMAMHWYRAETPTDALALGLPKTAKATIAECGDGVWIHLMSNPDNAPLMKRALEAMGPEAVAKANTLSQPNRNFPNWGANVAALKTRPSREWLEDFWAHDVSVQPALPMGEIYFDEQALANGYVVEVEDPALGKTRQPGPPASVSPAMRVRCPAPAPHANDEQALADWNTASIPRPKAAAMRVASQPLAGIKVIDFGNFLAGPLAAMLISDLGAEVIKVEATTGDQMRWVEWAFTGCQRGKRSLALQLKDPRARPVLERLVKQADVVHHNLRMPAAIKLGLGYDALKAINPKLIYCHVSSYGPKGPRRDWPGYDQLFQASCGWEYEGAGRGNPPMWHRFGMMDHQCAMASLYATLLALYHRQRTGEGQFVAASLLGACLLTASETIVGPDGKLTPYEKLDSAQTGLAPEHRIYQCRDGWIAVVSENENMLRKALNLAPHADLDQVFAQGRVAALAEQLSSAQILTAPVRENQRDAFFESESNRKIGLVASYPHKTYGRFEQVGAFWDFGDLSLKIDRAPPGLGEHSREILREIGFGDSEIESLLRDKVVAAG